MSTARGHVATTAVRKTVRRTSLFARGEAMVWLTGGTMVLLNAMILGLLAIVVWQGVGTFWPRPVLRVETVGGGAVLGQVTEREQYVTEPELLQGLPEEHRERILAELEEEGGVAERFQMRTGNFDLTGTHFRWFGDFEVEEVTSPEWALAIERLSWGRFYGTPKAFRVDGDDVATEPEAVWARFEEHHDEVRELWRERVRIEDEDVGEVSAQLEQARLELRRTELEHGAGSPEHVAAQEAYEDVEASTAREFELLRERTREIDAENGRYALVMETGDGTEASLRLDEVVRAVPANRLSLVEKASVFLGRWWEFLTDDPREANSEGGVFPAIFGTVLMTLIMSILVVPFGVLAALYLREYAKQGLLVSMVRIAVNNLAGVPSIVYGVFGLGFFCYIIGANIDELMYASKLPNPTYGKGGLLWASLTLSLLTLPVVIVATEEALSAVPSSMREGSYACGATKWQTIRRIVLPRAMPGIMTGMILAIARGAGEVAPLMLVGAVKLAPELPFSPELPFTGENATLLGTDRSFMHLGFHIYDLGFQSQNSEAAQPMVYTTTLLLIAIVISLNLFAVWVRGRLRQRFVATHV